MPATNRIKKLIKENTIHVGMSRQALVNLLGEPEDTSYTTRKIRIPLIWKYSGIEFHWIPKEDSLWLVIEANDSKHHTTLLIDHTAVKSNIS